ncbi:MAG: MmcQ/YjbR family DNA-binding protein [Acidobacteriota bacterium]|nr:MmcQ/YjbR family DNA-binding protein [Acidobacteriota bacterium]
MDLNDLKTYLHNKPGTTEEFPFGPEVAVFKVLGKMYALVPWAEEPLRVNLKCDPDLAEVLRATYPAVTPGYHMSKKHWNTVVIDGTIPRHEILQMVDNSYDLIVEKMKKADRQRLAEMIKPDGF